MIIPDVNLLPYATVSGFPAHRQAHRWWQDALNGSTPVGLAGPAVFGFLRIATNARILQNPLGVDRVNPLRQGSDGWPTRPAVIDTGERGAPALRSVILSVCPVKS